ncbi:MAG: glycosyltransferase family 4 protein [Bacteroidales bacterium]|jgi:UDP-GlcNAc:undecaprenyl-phosphate GlcNAc-1-phosphate transferase
MVPITINPLIEVLLAFSVALFVTWFYIPRIIKIASVKNLTDKPGERKVHHYAIPTLGGIGIFGGFAFGFLLAVDGQLPGIAYLAAASMILFFIGIYDDLINLRPRKKIIAEMFAALIIFLFTDMHFTNLHGFLGITELPFWLSLLITMFVVVVIINSLNLIDGIDGLAASVGIVSSAVLGIWFWLSGEYGYAIMASALLGSLIAFLRFNLSKGKNKIFMGDTGSLLIGFILAVLIIRFNEINAGSTSFIALKSAPAISIAILIVPLFDTLRVFTLRAVDGQSPFIADNRHIHHLMLRAGFSHRMSTLYISIAHLLIIGLAFWLDNIGILRLTLVLVSVCTFLTVLIKVKIQIKIGRKAAERMGVNKVKINLLYLERAIKNKAI